MAMMLTFRVNSENSGGPLHVFMADSYVPWLYTVGSDGIGGCPPVDGLYEPPNGTMIFGRIIRTNKGIPAIGGPDGN
jgi:hypothetical protein